MQITLFTTLELGKTLYYSGQYHEAETLVLKVNKGSGVSCNFELELNNLAPWYLSKIWLALGKHDQSKELALKTIDRVQDTLGAQHVYYTGMKEVLRQLWGINPDGTPFEGSVELETDDSSDEWETDNSSEGVAETTGQRNAEEQ